MNSFALVVYLHGSLGDFVDRLRRELVSGCQAQSHVTILPPRPLSISPEEACERVCHTVLASAPFRLEAGAVRVFDETSVVYLDLADGGHELVRLHNTLNSDGLFLEEPYAYYPHITLAQDFDKADLERLKRLAEQRWREYARARDFVADTVTFVQNTEQNRWIDLAVCRLGGPPPADYFRAGVQLSVL